MLSQNLIIYLIGPYLYETSSSQKYTSKYFEINIPSHIFCHWVTGMNLGFDSFSNFFISSKRFYNEQKSIYLKNTKYSQLLVCSKRNLTSTTILPII